MHPRVHRSIQQEIFRAVWLGGIILCGQLSILAVDKNARNIICRDDLSVQHRVELATKLRRITGWQDLAFEGGGALRLGTNEPVGGSSGARELLLKAISGINVVILEDASRRSDVAFCRVVPGRWKKDAAGQPPVYVVLLDFVDFEHLLGDSPAVDAFDVGWGLLHELDHVVNDSADSSSLGDSGECEAHINKMRRECNLPEREDYLYSLTPWSQDSPFITRFVRLPFCQDDGVNKKHYWLIWDASLVGGPEMSKQIAILR